MKINLFKNRDRSVKKTKKSVAGGALQGSKAGLASNKVSDFSKKLNLKKRANRRKRLVWLAVAASCLLMVGFLVWLVWFSQVLAVKKVVVEGGQITSQDAVILAAKVDVGKSLASVPTGKIAEQVEQLVTVDRAKVTRRWPDTVVIKITEPTQIYQRLVDSKYQWVDPSGNVFYTSATATKSVIVVESETDDQRLLADVAEVVKSLPESWKSRVAKIVAKSPDNITIYLDKSQEIFWGSASESEFKAKVATVLLNLKAKHFDVSSPTSPTSR